MDLQFRINIYSDGFHKYAEVQAIEADGNVVSEYPLDNSMVLEWADQITGVKEYSKGLQWDKLVPPSNVLVYNPNVLIWTVGSHKRKIKYHESHSASESYSAEVLFPDYMVVADFNQNQIYALPYQGEPGKDMKLFKSFLPNSNSSGSFCKGNISMPQLRTLRHYEAVMGVVNQIVFQTGHTSKMGCNGINMEEWAKQESLPQSYFKPVTYTLKYYIDGGNSNTSTPA